VAVFIAVFARRLREGKTYEDFLEAWYPDKGFGIDTRGPITGRGLEDEREILTVAFMDLPDRAALAEAGERIAAQEAIRHDRLDAVIESTELRQIYEQLDEFDFSSDASVERARPSIGATGDSARA
jgi:hypothetical protein